MLLINSQIDTAREKRSSEGLKNVTRSVPHRPYRLSASVPRPISLCSSGQVEMNPLIHFARQIHLISLSTRIRGWMCAFPVFISFVAAHGKMFHRREERSHSVRCTFEQFSRCCSLVIYSSISPIHQSTFRLSPRSIMKLYRERVASRVSEFSSSSNRLDFIERTRKNSECIPKKCVARVCTNPQRISGHINLRNTVKRRQ